jgi:hypothetical protein
MIHKRISIMFLAVCFLCPILFAQLSCPDQYYPPLTGYSVELDASQIAYDRQDVNDPNYADRQRLLLRVIVAPIKKAATYEGYACDEEPVKIHCQDGTLTTMTATGVPATLVDGWYPMATDRYTWRFTPTVIGVTYHWIEASDIRLETDDARMTRGTVVVVAIPKNAKPPRLRWINE